MGLHSNHIDSIADYFLPGLLLLYFYKSELFKYVFIEYLQCLNIQYSLIT